MQLAHSLTRISALALGVAGALACGQVHAAAFQLKENSVKAQGRAMAGAASAKGDASVVSNNPAMMSTFDRATLQGDVTAIDLSFEFEGSGYAASGTPLQQPLTGGDGGDAGGVSPVPAMSFILPLEGSFEYLTLGAMVSAPFGLKTEYDDGWQGRYHALNSDVKIIDLTLAASVELGDHFSAGLGAVIPGAGGRVVAAQVRCGGAVVDVDAAVGAGDQVAGVLLRPAGRDGQRLDQRPLLGVFVEALLPRSPVQVPPPPPTATESMRGRSAPRSLPRARPPRTAPVGRDSATAHPHGLKRRRWTTERSGRRPGAP